ncbi:hypothetical protein CMMCAS07_12840 [Clavibacter michiganensis subsp. michiganensis]|uniref:Uncharacterized protein n=1 Tax=Clavibacter michiganensis subsp. michiganensis TaxID=33013 RepID=A0A251XIC1_CLAMM|nr:hypothetical protein CMMCAS07_12840 [Clavibacter michiganensis subsp. michiganensis]
MADAPSSRRGASHGWGAVSCVLDAVGSGRRNAPLSKRVTPASSCVSAASGGSARSRGMRAPRISPCCESVIASLLAGESACFLAS